LWFKKTKQKQVAKEFCLLCPFVVQKNETKVSSKRLKRQAVSQRSGLVAEGGLTESAANGLVAEGGLKKQNNE
jgi:hypothetical protein